jgi:ferredoxin-NADP reductase
LTKLPTGAGVKPMAAHTESNFLKRIDTGVYLIFGYRTPENVIHVEVSTNIADAGKKFSWICKNKTQHSMVLDEFTHESITALIAAMRLSC